MLSADVLPWLDHGPSEATARRSPKDYRPSQWPLLRHLIERRLEKAIISERWTAGQSDAKSQKQQGKTMNDSEQWQQHRAFGALDWASEKHFVIVVDQAGKVIEEFEIEHSALG